VEGVIKIERADGQVFNLNVARLSQADQDYLRSFTEPASAGPAETSGGSEGLRVLSPQDWELLAQLLSITPRTYADTPADEVVEMLNRRLAASEFRLPDGRPISIRLEGEATQARISADIRYAVNLATFLQDVTKSSRLELRLDAKQQLVLLASSAANQGKEPIKFLGL
jgi:hypothetical protein